MHKISIIIPIYNVDKYLSACIETVIHQTYQNLEIILVNDGSTDACPQICDDYAAKDQRIIVIHKKNGGLSDARNAGMKLATGDYISFVDSDDLLSLDFYQNLLNALTRNDADIAECGFFKFGKDIEFNIEVADTENADAEIFNTETALELLIKDYVNPMVWNKLYRKEVLKDLEFPVGKIHEDVFWTYRVVGNAKKIVKIKNKMYGYRQQLDSISGKKYSLLRLYAVEALEERIEYMKDNFPQLEYLAIYTYCFSAMSHYHMIDKYSEIDPQKNYRKKIRQSIKNYNKYKVVEKWNLKTIFWFEFFLLFPSVCLWLRRHINKARNLE